MRLIHAVRDINAEARDAEPIRTIALYTDAEPTAMFVREADLAYTLGPAAGAALPQLRPARAGAAGHRAPTPPGSAGASSPRTRRSPSCARGSASPSSARRPRRCASSATRSARSCIAEEVGVPVAPWSRGAVDTLDDARRPRPTAIGYPLMLKATAGGGGRGIRVIRDEAELRERLPAHPRRGRPRVRQRRACSSSGWSPARGTSRCRSSPTATAPRGRSGVRDCSVQRRNQKVIEESASPLLSPGAGRRARRPRPSGWRWRSATAARARSSSCTTRARRPSPSSR